MISRLKDLTQRLVSLIPPFWHRPIVGIGCVLVLILGVLALGTEQGPSQIKTTAEKGAEGGVLTPEEAAAQAAAEAQAQAKAQARALAKAAGRSGAGAAGALSVNHKGVTDKKFRVGFSWQHESCGNFFGPGLAAAFGVPQPEDQEAINAGIDYFEKHANEVSFIANAPADVKAAVGSGKGYWGRTVEPFFADNGGPFCADAARAMVTDFAQTKKVFAAMQIPNDGGNYVIAGEASANKLVNIGAAGFRDADYKAWSPWAWDSTFSGSKAVRGWASWACRDLVSGTTFDTGALSTPPTSKVPRVLGLLRPDDPLYKGLADEVKATLQSRCDGKFKIEQAYSLDVAAAQQTADTAMKAMEDAGVTTIYLLTDILFPAFFTTEATKDNYYPEWAVSSVGFQDIAFVIRHLWNEQQKKNAFGASHLVAADRQPWFQTETYKAFKKVRPNREPPGNWNNWYIQMAILYAGVAGAGPVLNQDTFASGLHRLCGPCTRTSNKALLVGYGIGDPTGTDDFTLLKFNPNKQDVYDPPDQYNGQPQNGYWDFPEGGVRYLETIDRPSN